VKGRLLGLADCWDVRQVADVADEALASIVWVRNLEDEAAGSSENSVTYLTDHTSRLRGQFIGNRIY
jgi:hypothetical protein